MAYYVVIYMYDVYLDAFGKDVVGPFADEQGAREYIEKERDIMMYDDMAFRIEVRDV